MWAVSCGTFTSVELVEYGYNRSITFKTSI